jgi:hypothetical protein
MAARTWRDECNCPFVDPGEGPALAACLACSCIFWMVLQLVVGPSYQSCIQRGTAISWAPRLGRLTAEDFLIQFCVGGIGPGRFAPREVMNI